MPNHLTPEGLEAIGQSLFGQHWAMELATRLSVADRTVRRWLAGTRGIPDFLPGELRKIAKERSAGIKATLAKHLLAESGP